MEERELKLEIGLKKAVDWILEHRQDEPNAGLATLIDRASRQFDLTPLQADFLYRHLANLDRG
jgi:hypothetical protein